MPEHAQLASRLVRFIVENPVLMNDAYGVFRHIGGMGVENDEVIFFTFTGGGSVPDVGLSLDFTESVDMFGIWKIGPDHKLRTVEFNLPKPENIEEEPVVLICEQFTFDHPVWVKRVPTIGFLPETAVYFPMDSRGEATELKSEDSILEALHDLINS